MTTSPAVQVFGPDRPAAARAACFELQQAMSAREDAGGGWAPDRFHTRVVEARGIHAMYNCCDDGALPVPNIADTCCGKCPGASCYVDQVTGA